MNTFIFARYLGILSVLSLFQLQAAATTTQAVTFSVDSIQVISVSGNPAPLNITTPSPGSTPSSVTDNSTTYALTNNLTSQNISGSLSGDMPSNTALSIQLVAPEGATSSGTVNLTTTPQTLVTGIGPVASSGLTITYTFSADVLAGPVTSTTRTVTLTFGS